MKNKLSAFKNLFVIILIFVFLIIFVSGIFAFMNKRTEKLNEETVESIGITYISGLTNETVNHSKTYFEGKFDVLDKIIDKVTSDKDASKELFNKELTKGAVYAALLDENGERDVIRGDESFRPLNMEEFQNALEEGQNKVILSVNDKDEKIIEMVLFRDFEFAGRKYSAFMCGITAETLNSILNLSYNEEMVYSFIIRKEDGNFVVHNENAQRISYFDRVRDLYKEYDGHKPSDYIEELKDTMARGEDYSAIFLIDGECKMLYARQFSYSDWYIITFISYDEIESLMDANNEERNKLFNSCLILLCIIFVAVFMLYAIMSYKQLKKQQELKQKAIQANKSKSEFLSNMSHDIRTPMNVIVGMTDIALSNINDNVKTEDCLNKIAKSSRHLLSLINDVLDMSKIESGKMTLSLVQISLRETMENIVAIAQPNIKSKNQKFDIYINNIISENVFCDSLRLNQVLINLLSNATKYTQEGGTITLSLDQEESPNGKEYVRTHIRVKDNGIGMSEEFLSVVFDNFVREDRDRVGKEEGTGLGLAITKHIVDVMNGTIEVQSKPKKGSEFHVTLDFERGMLESDAMDMGGLKVLVVDDDEDLCKSAVDSLSQIGTKSEYVVTGAEAVERIIEDPESYDVILVDWQMDDMDGIETTRKLREYTKSDVPIILISAYDWGDIEDKAKDAGINGFISKPLFKSTLFHGISQHLNGEGSKIEKEEDSINFKNERVLLAEDNELNSEIAMAILTEAGLQVEWAENGQICTEMFSNSPEGYYNAILMDIRMPIMNGYEATKIIRGMDRNDSNIPIIAMTADAFAEDIAKAKNCGMNGHVAKPLDVNSLFYLLKREMKNK
jgi:hypothetical protein